MEQIKSSIHPRKGKHLTQKERIMIETMLKNRGRPLEIARAIWEGIVEP
ncbi:MAG: hypothetical protein GKR87_12710 [Kiritimatiellae bacterium]|nr:hypothetical protein [Kiritimatiellia bacterium]NKB25212.1 hypothetical protein [Kiritimatiellia bacterium]